ncbi:MAG: efflux RND transporter periplasmic adaptor subunit [Bryobacterales bacterium]|nr:efflux RND transporter periplasmic adaptor subunit [Bryobacteraceae bacterium]MDW8353234.1 efflux RND transporter periplasmic adaptor subunit [Bryobacterales bacterium]
MKLARWLGVLLAIAAAFLAGYGWGRWYGRSARMPSTSAAEKKPAIYYCPMHPSYTLDRPGDCPICGMRLVALEDKTQQPAGASDRASELPHGVFHVPVERQQLIGVRYGTVEVTSGLRTVRAVGKVGVDETKIARIHPKVEGWIEEVFVDFVGKFVKQGEPLLTIYSPELLATQQEYLLALRARRVLSPSPPSAAETHTMLRDARRQMERWEMGESLLEAARRRLELWDVSPTQIEELERTGKPRRTVTLYAPISGYVTARNAFPKQRVAPEVELYTLVDFSRVWVIADVFESEAAAIRLGQAAIVSLPYDPGRRFPARVNYVQPSVDPTTRTLKVRLELANPRLVLKPEMFVDVEFRIAEPPRLTVPVDAVLDSGLTKTVFVDRGNGYLEPRPVETGELLGDRIVIVKGLQPGERIVTSGTFLIDSESRLKAAAAGMTPQAHATTEPAAPARAPVPPSGEHRHD